MISPFVIVASTQDSASMTMATYLIEQQDFSLEKSKECYTSTRHKNVSILISDDSLLQMDYLDDIFPHANAFVFLSKHKSQSGIQALTCHFPGNFGSSQFGGNDRELSIAHPCLQKQYLKALMTQRGNIADYHIVIESSHHGPTSLMKPALFVEIGSTEREWTDRVACSIICECILNVIDSKLPSCDRIAVCLGGTHYPYKFSKLVIDSEYGLAAVAAKHDLSLIDREMLWQMLAKSVEKVNTIIVDWKGLGKEKERIMTLATDTGLEIVKV